MNNRSLTATAMVCATALMITTIVSNAGPLTPPAGPVASTNKTLIDVEPRIAVNAVNTPGDANTLFKITQPGSYYLTGNIAGNSFKDGIQITSSGVTLDLMGFDLCGAAGSIDGISVTAGVYNVHIRNGSVRDWGDDGVNAGSALNSSLQDLHSFDNGNQGLRIGVGGLVRNCNALSNGGTGIFTSDTAIVERCTVRSNGAGLPGSFGIKTSTGSMVIDCTVLDQTGDGISAGIGNAVRGCVVATSTGDGIVTSVNSSVQDCTVKSNGDDGIRVFNGCTVRDNNVYGSADDGIETSDKCYVINNHCDGNSNGIRMSGDESQVDGNFLTGTGSGFYFDGTRNIVTRNVFNGLVFGTQPGNHIGPSDDISAEFFIDTTSPLANLDY